MSEFAKPKRRSFRTLLSAICKRCRPALLRGVHATKADRYAKRYRSAEFALALVVHFLKGMPSLRALQVAFGCNRSLTRTIKLGGISNAQLAQLTHRRPAQLWEPLLVELLGLVARQVPSSPLRLMDSTFFPLSARLMSRCWQRHFEPEAAGIKLTATYDPVQGAPVDWHISTGAGSDAGEGPAVLPDGNISGHIYLFDRGFRKYAFYQQLIDRGADFVTLGSVNMRYEVTEELALAPAHEQILCDQVVVLGSANGRNLMGSPVRRIVLRDGKRELVFVSSLFDLEAAQVCELYRRRWDIEVFFRWLKRQIGCLKPLGYSPQAAKHTIFAALVAYLLVLLMALTARKRPEDPIRMANALYRLQANLDQPPETSYLQVLRL